MNSTEYTDDCSAVVEVLEYNVPFLHLLPGKHGPATIFYHEGSGIVVLIVHDYETEGLSLVRSSDPIKIKATEYYFYRSSGFRNNCPIIREDIFKCVCFRDYENCLKTPDLILIPEFFLETAINQVVYMERLKSFLEKHGYVLPVLGKWNIWRPTPRGSVFLPLNVLQNLYFNV